MSDGPVVAAVVGAILLGIGILLTLILVPLHFSYIERQHLGFKKNTATKEVDTSRAYTNGRYGWGVTKTAVEFDATYQPVTLKLNIFADGGQTINVGFKFYYHITTGTLAQLYAAFGPVYHERVVSLARSELRNTGPRFTFEDYISRRTNITEVFHSDLQTYLRTHAFVEVPRHAFMMMNVALPTTVLNQRTQVFFLNQIQITQAYNLTAQQTRLETQQNVSKINALAAVVRTNASATAKTKRETASNQAIADVQKETGIQIKGLITTLGVQSDANSTERLIEYTTYLDATNKMTLLSGVSSTILKSP